jgi:tRNA(Glu) U13 pseudouridine synthase TruD
VHTHEIGRFLLQKKWKEAVESILFPDLKGDGAESRK